MLGAKLGGAEVSTTSSLCDASGDSSLNTAGSDCLRCAGSSDGLLLAITDSTSGVCDLLTLVCAFECMVKYVQHLHM